MPPRKKISFLIDKNGCFNCNSHAQRGNGYPCITISGKLKNMHRYLYEELFGELSPGLVVRHKCDNRLCINPEHLEKGTIKDNNQDIWERGRENPNRKFNKKEVFKILERINNGELQKNIAKELNVSVSTINHIKTGRNYKRLIS